MHIIKCLKLASSYSYFFVYSETNDQARGCILVASSPEILTHVKKVCSYDAFINSPYSISSY
jgi:isochorismate synthase EntC